MKVQSKWAICLLKVNCLFLSLGKILRKIGHLNAMSLVLFAFGIRFILFSSLVNPWWILPIEGLNGITFGIFYATMTTYASVISPPGAEATVQNLVGAMFEGVGEYQLEMWYNNYLYAFNI